MEKLKRFYTNLKPYLNKYIIAVVVFVVFIVFIDENNVIKRVEYELQIRGLRKEIRHYEKMRDENSKKLQRLHSSDSELERVAREDYLMKKSNEEVFIVE